MLRSVHIEGPPIEGDNNTTAPLPNDILPPFRSLRRLRMTLLLRSSDDGYPSNLPRLTAPTVSPALYDLDVRIVGDAPPPNAFALWTRRNLRRLVLVLRVNDSPGRGGAAGLESLTSGASSCDLIRSVTVDARSLAPLETVLPDVGLAAAVDAVQHRLRTACTTMQDPAPDDDPIYRKRYRHNSPVVRSLYAPTNIPPGWNLLVRYRNQHLRIFPDRYEVIEATEGDLVW